ncbi:MAG: glycosyltransferase [Alistipes sp.]
MHILYSSVLCSDKVTTYLSSVLGYPVQGVAVHRFHEMIVRGFVLNDCIVTTISNPPMLFKGREMYQCFKTETIGNVTYSYCPRLRLPIIKHFVTAFVAFVKSVKWCLKQKKNESVIICDVLNVSASLGSLLAGKLWNIKVVCIVTDLPDSPGFAAHPTFMQKLVSRINSAILYRYDAYVLLTETMNTIVNPHHRPHIVMEGVAEAEPCTEHKIAPKMRKIVYAGSIHEQFGIKRLMLAFQLLPHRDIQLCIYGMGNMSEEMAKYEEADSRLHYYGLVSNDEIKIIEHEAYLLVNPRPTDAAYTRYSFPSKNMEYMASGTPLLTTRLAGIPQEYYDFIYTLDDESVDGIYATLNNLLNAPAQELIDKGLAAQTYVLKYKNNIYQTKRILKSLCAYE